MLEQFGIVKASAVGGAIGALISLRFASGMSLAGKLFMFFCGFGMAAFLTPTAAHFFNVGEKLYGGIGLLIGIFGMAVVSAAMKAISEFWDAVKTAMPDWFKSRFGK